MAVLENPDACPCVAVVRLHLRELCRADDRVSVRLRTLYGGSHRETLLSPGVRQAARLGVCLLSAIRCKLNIEQCQGHIMIATIVSSPTFAAFIFASGVLAII